MNHMKCQADYSPKIVFTKLVGAAIVIHVLSMVDVPVLWVAPEIMV